MSSESHCEMCQSVFDQDLNARIFHGCSARLSRAAVFDIREIVRLTRLRLAFIGQHGPTVILLAYQISRPR